MDRRLISRLGFALLKRGFRPPLVSKIIQFEEYRRVRDLVSETGVNIVIDVGAYHGWFAEHLRWFGYTGRIVSYEPESSAFRLLRSAAAQDPGWFVRNCALGPKPASMELNIVEEAKVLNSLRKPIGAASGSRTETIEVDTLDNQLAGIVDGIAEPRIFLKLDTQGYDLEVLRGATQVLGHVVLFQSEVSVIPLYEDMPHYTEALAHYEAFGFELQDLFVVSRRGLRPVEYDAIMTPKNSAQ